MLQDHSVLILCRLLDPDAEGNVILQDTGTADSVTQCHIPEGLNIESKRGCTVCQNAVPYP